MEFLTNLLDNTTLPWLTALLLGLMTAISPCPLATNITAIGFISKDIENRNRVFINGLVYTLGRAITYTVIALIIFLGADQMKFGGFFQRYGEKIVGPLLILIGLFMLGIIKIKFPGFNKLTSGMQNKKRWGYFDALLLGLLFALAFCPYSGVLYFGMLIPLCFKRLRPLPPNHLCCGNRNSGNNYCMGPCLYCFRDRHCLQQDKIV